MLWKSVPSILIGKNQNTYSEINVPYVKENQIPVVRRMSGGGTVFCDMGNMNFTFIESGSSKAIDFRKFTAPILEVLNKLGANAEFSGRNDLVIEGKKFSGNAQYRIGTRILHHGTLLYDSSISNLSKALTPKDEKFIGKSVKSVASRVTNIKNHIDTDMDAEGFRQHLLKEIYNQSEDNEFYEFTEDDIQAIEKIVEEKYETWAWNFGDSPKYAYKNLMKVDAGLIEVFINIKKGHISEFKLFGDFFTLDNIDSLENEFIDLPFTPEDIRKKVEAVQVGRYINNMTSKDFITLLTEL